jgi:cytochrome P450
MILYPSTQELAAKELQSIVSQGRLPDFSDDLPYIHAIVKECLRWNPTVPLGAYQRSVRARDVGWF